MGLLGLLDGVQAAVEEVVKRENCPLVRKTFIEARVKGYPRRDRYVV
jgi:hypothetical protein